ncbi:MAG: hypothetical protein M3033_12435 [Acidobacteriota bacterium]|nr:hypothetical protein [Acidobacteriota bacterium]
MKIKSILSIAAFSTAFILSTFLAGLFVDKSDYQSNLVPPVSENQLQNYRQPDSSELQKRIWMFLDEDRDNGLAMGRELRSSQTPDLVVNEQTATINLSIKMNRMTDADLPSDFRAAWENHVTAWDTQASFLRRAVKSGNRQTMDDDLMSDYRKNYQEIDRTYFVLLGVAENHGVYFPR